VFKKKHHHKDKEAGGGSGKRGGGGRDEGGKAARSSSPLYSSDDALDQILHYMGRSCKQEHEIPSPRPRPAAASRYLRPIETVLGGHGFMKLPPLESPSAAATPRISTTTPLAASGVGNVNRELDELHIPQRDSGITDWAMMDRLVASHLNGQHDASTDQLCFDGGSAGNAGDNDDVVDNAAVDGLAFYSAAATRLLGGTAGAGGGSIDDDLWAFARSAAPSEPLSHVSR
jgi:hypothetical protein